VLYFDRVDRLIALRFTNDDRQPGRLSLQSTGSVSALGFFGYFGLDVNQLVRRYTPVKQPCRELGIDWRGDCFVIDLKARPGSGR
jgi:hypothetical protein